jgi:hypothetical protein
MCVRCARQSAAGKAVAVSQKAAFHRMLERAVRDPDLAPWLKQITEHWRSVLNAAEAGDAERVEELIADLQARTILMQALGAGWSF